MVACDDNCVVPWHTERNDSGAVMPWSSLECVFVIAWPPLALISNICSLPTHSSRLVLRQIFVLWSAKNPRSRRRNAPRVEATLFPVLTFLCATLRVTCSSQGVAKLVVSMLGNPPAVVLSAQMMPARHLVLDLWYLISVMICYSSRLLLFIWREAANFLTFFSNRINEKMGEWKYDPRERARRGKETFPAWQQGCLVIFSFVHFFSCIMYLFAAGCARFLKFRFGLLSE